MRFVLETRTRSIVKTVTWRCLATGTTIVILYALTGQISFSVSTGILVNFVKTILYYLHERLWARVTWGTRVG